MKKSVVFNNQFTPKLGGQFELESGGQFAPELVVNLHWKVVVNLTGFSTIGKNSIEIFQKFIKSKSIPQLVINTTVSSKDNDNWLSQVFEYTPFNRGNPEIGFEKYNINQPVTLDEAITISGAALKVKLMRKTDNYSSKIEGKYLPLSDGGHSENLGAISLIRRGVRNIIIIDAEHNDNYSFDGYKILKKNLNDKLDLNLSIPSIDSFIKGDNKTLLTSVHFGHITSLYISPEYIKTSLSINVYYVKMAMPESITNKLNDNSTFKIGDSINKAYNFASCQSLNKRNECKYYNSNFINIYPSVEEFKALSVYWVKSYSDWLNKESKWKHLNYTFPHTTTADQSFYRDQIAAFIGLGYLESIELNKYLKQIKK